MTRPWLNSLFRCLVLGAVCCGGLLQVPATAADAADSTTSAAATRSSSDNLHQLLAGAKPTGVADLRAMQSHIQKLAEQTKKCTVGLQVGRAWGSGVIISHDGYVLTAAHVAGKPNRDCIVTLADGREVAGKTLGMYKTLDAGLIKITEPGDYPFAEIGDSSQLKQHQWCIALGHPGGYHSERGMVLRLGRVLHIAKDAVTTSCTLVGGDSGGPLFDMDGHVIGINSRIAELLTTNMHVPVSAYKERNAWDRMVRGEVWGHLPGHEPYLGVGGDDRSIARIARVNPKSPAEKGGLKTGDVVLTFNGQELTDFESLANAVADCQPNEEVTVRVKRDGQVLELIVKLERRPQS
jgi:serine protease Do